MHLVKILWKIRLYLPCKRGRPVIPRSFFKWFNMCIAIELWREKAVLMRCVLTCHWSPSVGGRNAESEKFVLLRVWILEAVSRAQIHESWDFGKVVIVPGELPLRMDAFSGRRSHRKLGLNIEQSKRTKKRTLIWKLLWKLPMEFKFDKYLPNINSSTLLYLSFVLRHFLTSKLI